MDTSIQNLIRASALSIFNSITFIDILEDKVSLFSCDEKMEVTTSDKYEDYLDKLQKLIHPDFANEYFNTISLNNIKNNGDGIIWIPYMKLSSSLGYDNYLDAIKLINDNAILILSFKVGMNNNIKEEAIDSEYSFANFIVNVEKLLNNIKTNDGEIANTVKYILELINDELNQNKKLKDAYSNKVSVDVNQKYRSLLIVDDDNLTRNIFKKVFEKDYHIIEAKNGVEAVDIIEENVVCSNKENPENIVGMFLDLKMPVMDGFGVLKYLQDKRLLDQMPVVIISADDAKETKEQVYSYDIADMIEKPFNFELIKKRVNTMVRMYQKSNILNSLVRTKGKGLEDIINAYTNAYLIDYENINNLINKNFSILLHKYQDTGVNIDVDNIVASSKYYDVAINTVPKKYIMNTNNLNNEERKVIYNYPNIGTEVLKHVTDNTSDSFVNYGTQIIKKHNERYDGTGFPEGLQKEEIPMYVYLFGIAKEYSYLLFNKHSVDEAISSICGKSGTKYDPKAIEIFKSSLEDMK